MEVWIAPVRFGNKVSEPLDGIIWLCVVSTSFLCIPLLKNWCEEISRSGVAFPDGSKFGDEILYNGAKPRMKESKFCRGEKDVSCILQQVSGQA